MIHNWQFNHTIPSLFPSLFLMTPYSFTLINNTYDWYKLVGITYFSTCAVILP